MTKPPMIAPYFRLAFVILALPTALFAQTVFHDTFDSGSNANDHGWFFRGESLVTGAGTVESGSLMLANNGNAPSNGSGVWKQFSEVTIPEDKTLRVTVRISEIEARVLGFGLTFALVSAPNPIQTDGPLLGNEGGVGLPRFQYALRLPRATGRGGVATTDEGHFGYIQAFAISRSEPAESSLWLTDGGIGARNLTEEVATTLPVVATPRTFFTSGHYTEPATLVWDIRNSNGKMTFSGSFTPPDGGDPVELLEQDATCFQHRTFDKFFIGSQFWGFDPDGLSKIRIDDVKIELIPNP